MGCGPLDELALADDCPARDDRLAVSQDRRFGRIRTFDNGAALLAGEGHRDGLLRRRTQEPLADYAGRYECCPADDDGSGLLPERRWRRRGLPRGGTLWREDSLAHFP